MFLETFTAPGRPRAAFQQGRVNMFRYSFAILLGFCAATSARASWADGLFDELSRDFGSVPRGPTLQHPFRVVNKTDQYVTISGVRVSCGCVSAQALKATLAPGEETAI